MIKFIAAIFLFLFVLAGVLVFKFVQVGEDEEKNRNTAQQQKGTISLALDAYAGYYPLRSEQMVTEMLSKGYRLALEVDEGDYASRVDMLKKGEIDLAVFTVDSFILNGMKEDFPGTIIAVLSESRGADAIVARADIASTLDDLKGNEDLRVSYTPKSPSEHLLKVVGSHFGVDRFLNKRGKWRVESDGSEDAMDKLKSNQSDVAVLWEPHITRILDDKDYVKLLGTELTKGIIVDVLVANRTFLQDKAGEAELLLSTYFKVLKELRTNKTSFISGLSKQEKVSKKLAEKMIEGVNFVSLYDNAVEWFGIPIDGQSAKFGLYQNIEQTTQVLVQAGDFSSSPLPDGDPRKIFIDRYIQNLKSTLSPEQKTQASENISFIKLSDSAWNQLKPVGTLKVDPIPFNTGSGKVDGSGIESIEKIIETLSNYPTLRIMVEGHTGTNGDRDANIELSNQRANAIVDTLISRFGINKNRLKAVGVGPDKPLARSNDESIRAWRNRLSRVEIKFLKEII